MYQYNHRRPKIISVHYGIFKQEFQLENYFCSLDGGGVGVIWQGFDVEQEVFL